MPLLFTQNNLQDSLTAGASSVSDRKLQSTTFPKWHECSINQVQLLLLQRFLLYAVLLSSVNPNDLCSSSTDAITWKLVKTSVTVTLHSSANTSLTKSVMCNMQHAIRHQLQWNITCFLKYVQTQYMQILSFALQLKIWPVFDIFKKQLQSEINYWRYCVFFSTEVSGHAFKKVHVGLYFIFQNIHILPFKYN